MMIRQVLRLLAILALFLPAVASAAPRQPVTIMVSIDGFRADYLQRGATPHLLALARGGVNAPMRAAFPTKTFPNHWTLVTGLVPDSHGIVANRFEDPARPGEVFTLSNDDPFWWNAAAPIWVEAERAGVRSATMFWPGSNVGWGGQRPEGGTYPISGGHRPQDWQQFNQEVSATQRVNSVLDWLRRPPAIRPKLILTYFDAVDTAGHEYGPDDPRTMTALTDVDSAIGDLVRGLRELGQPANLVIVADHGMAAIDGSRMIALDGVADPASYRVIENGPYAGLVPQPGHEAQLAEALLKPHPHMQCWRKQDIPARLHYGANPRVPPFICLAEVGWMILPTAPQKAISGGAHGYDNAAPEMAALFIANGPAFKRGAVLPTFDNVAIAPLLRHLLRLNQGTPLAEPLRGMLR